MPIDAKPNNRQASGEKQRLERNSPRRVNGVRSGASVVVLTFGSWVSAGSLFCEEARATTPPKQVMRQPTSYVPNGFVGGTRKASSSGAQFEVPSSVTADVRSSISSRLDALRDIAIEEEIAWNEEAERQLWAFLDLLPSPSRPAIAIDQNGDLRVLWENMLQEQVAVRFKGAAAVEAVLFQKTEHGVRREVVAAEALEVSRLVREMKLLHVTRG